MKNNENRPRADLPAEAIEKLNALLEDVQKQRTEGSGDSSSELEKRLSDAEANIVKNQKDIAEAETKILQNQTGLAEAEKEISQTSAELADAQSKISENAAGLSEAKTKISENADSLAAAQAKILENSAGLAEAEGNITQNQTDIAGLCTQLSSVAQDLEQTNQNAEALGTRLDGLESNFSSLKTGLESDLATLREDFESNLATLKESFDSDFASLKSGLEEKTDANKTAIDGLRESVSAQDGRISSLENSAGLHASRLDSIEAQLSEMKTAHEDLSAIVTNIVNVTIPTLQEQIGAGGGSAEDDEWVTIYDKDSDDPAINYGLKDGIKGVHHNITDEKMPDLKDYNRIKIRFNIGTFWQYFEFDTPSEGRYYVTRFNMLSTDSSGSEIYNSPIYFTTDSLGLETSKWVVQYYGTAHIGLYSKQYPIVIREENADSLCHISGIWAKK